MFLESKLFVSMNFELILMKFFFSSVLGNVTNVIVNVDEFKVHENKDGSVDKTKTDVYLHLVDKKDNSILDVSDVLRLVDLNIEKLDGLFKVCSLFFMQGLQIIEFFLGL